MCRNRLPVYCQPTRSPPHLMLTAVALSVRFTAQRATGLYGFLFRHYEERQFWWEMMVLGRKLIFALIVNLPKAPEQQAMLGILCLIPYISLVYVRSPYSSRWLNYMDLLGAFFAGCLALSGLTMFGGLETELTTSEVRD